MAITVKIEGTEEKEISFPCLMKSSLTGLVVLFTNDRAGIVLAVQEANSFYHLGYISNSWDSAYEVDWEPSPPITLSNS